MATSFIELASACTGKPSNAVKCHICREMGLPCPNQCCLFPMRFSPRSARNGRNLNVNNGTNFIEFGPGEKLENYLTNEVKDDDDDSITPDWVVDFEEEDSDSEDEDDLDFGETKSKRTARKKVQHTKLKNDLSYEEFAQKYGVRKADVWYAYRAYRATLKPTKGLESIRVLVPEELMYYEEFSDQYFKVPIRRRQDHGYVNPPENWWNRRRLFAPPLLPQISSSAVCAPPERSPST